MRGAYDTPTEPCPYCGADCDADWVDVGVGMVQCGPYHCLGCKASEIGPHDKPRPLTDLEQQTGWYAPDTPPGSSANVIGGQVVSYKEMDAAYRKEFTANPDYEEPGRVEAWFDAMRQ